MGGQKEFSSKTQSTGAETVLCSGSFGAQDRFLGGRDTGLGKRWPPTENGNEAQQLLVPSPSYADMPQADLDPGGEASLSRRPAEGHTAALETDRGLNPHARLLVLLYFSVRLSTLSLSVLVCKWGR